jgi:hypothetical protein
MKCFVDFVGKIIWHLLPTLTAITISGLLIQRFFVRKANASAFVDVIFKELQSLRSDAFAYWSVVDADKDALLEAQLKGYIQTIFSDVEYYCMRYKIKEDTNQVLVNLCVSLADAVTGDDFEQANRKASTAKYLQILNIINKIRSEIQRTKL